MKVYIYTLGCRVNHYESDSIVNELEKNGHSIVDDARSAELFVINTCAVTNEAEKKSRQSVSKLLKLSPIAKVIVIGCASQKNAEQFKNMKNVSYVCGTENKLSLVNHLNENIINIEQLQDNYKQNYTPTVTQSRAYVKIQDGCNNFCSYCIIPYLRGRSRSRDKAEIISEIKVLSNKVHEVVLTGINILDYKIDKKSGLLELLKEIDSLNIRFRLGSIEKTLIDNNFVKELSKLKNLCPHFHLSLQSGCDSVLRRMNRHYTTNDFYKTVKLLRKYFQNPTLTTDVIVGFPGETEKEFIKTFKFIKKIKLSDIHIFPYSKREGTNASKMKQVDGVIKKQRVKKLNILKIKLFNKFIKSNLNTKQNLLVEQLKNGLFVGHTEKYLKCYSKEKTLKINEIYNIKVIKQFKDGVLVG